MVDLAPLKHRRSTIDPRLILALSLSLGSFRVARVSISCRYLGSLLWRSRFELVPTRGLLLGPRSAPKSTPERPRSDPREGARLDGAREGESGKRVVVGSSSSASGVESGSALERATPDPQRRSLDRAQIENASTPCEGAAGTLPTRCLRSAQAPLARCSGAAWTSLKTPLGPAQWPLSGRSRAARALLGAPLGRPPGGAGALRARARCSGALGHSHSRSG